MIPPQRRMRNGRICTESTLDIQREGQDLCLHCATRRDCIVAQQLLLLASEFKVRTITTRCPNWEKQ